MSYKLVIVESPAKTGSFEKALGPGYKCMASYGHIRELKKLCDIDRENEYTPTYINSTGKLKQITKLKDAAKKSSGVILATDDDKEGEAIAWHLCQVLRLPVSTTPRLIFHEVTRVLKVGGYFYIGLPNLASLHNRLLLLFDRQPTSIQNSSAHVRGYTKSDMVKFLETCWPKGYSVQKFSGSNFYPLPPILAKTDANLMPNPAVSIFLLIRKEKEYTDAFLEHPRDLESNFFLGYDIHHVVTGMRQKSVGVR